MILQLRSVPGSEKGGIVDVKQMPMPIPTNKIPVIIEYEHDTNHLSTTLTIGYNSYTGRGSFVVDLDHTHCGRHVPIHVVLKNASGVVVKEYLSFVFVHAYVVFGPRPIRPDVDTYIQQLEAEIKLLKEQGDVI